MAALAVYLWRGIGSIHQVTWIPLAEYGLVALLALLIWTGLAIARAVRPKNSGVAVEKPPARASSS